MQVSVSDFQIANPNKLKLELQQHKADAVFVIGD